MASAKATFTLIGLVLLLTIAGVGGAYLLQMFQERSVQKDLKTAETALKEHRPRDAEQLLVNRLDRAKPRTSWAPQALALRLRALDELDDSPTATALAQKILNPDQPWVRPGDEAWARAHLILANTALANNLADQARQHLEAVLNQPPRGANDPVLDEAQMGLARIELASGKMEAGRDRLAALQERLTNESPIKPRVERVLGDVNSRMLFDRQPYGRDQIHMLVKGDSLDRLSKQYKISSDLLMGVNQISDPRRLRINTRIKIPDLQLSLVVDKFGNTLTVYNYGKFFKRYTVRTGKNDYQTPLGDFTILMKVKDPKWFNKELNQTVPPGDPSNELGARWLGFQGTSLGIHEARDPASLGKYSSNGCVGMARQDVVELFDMVPAGTPLKIQGQMNTALMVTNTTGGGLGGSDFGLGSPQTATPSRQTSPATPVPRGPSLPSVGSTSTPSSTPENIGANDQPTVPQEASGANSRNEAQTGASDRRSRAASGRARATGPADSSSQPAFGQ